MQQGAPIRGVSVEGDIARTLVYKEKNSSLVQINNAQTDYGVTFDLIDPLSIQLSPHLSIYRS